MSELDRFLKAQENSFGRALSEIENGKKVTHWMWYISFLKSKDWVNRIIHFITELTPKWRRVYICHMRF